MSPLEWLVTLSGAALIVIVNAYFLPRRKRKRQGGVDSGAGPA